MPPAAAPGQASSAALGQGPRSHSGALVALGLDCASGTAHGAAATPPRVRFRAAAARDVDPPSCRNVRFSDVGWTDVTSTTALTAELLRKHRLHADDHRAVGAGHLRLAQEQGHRRVPRQLDAGPGGRSGALRRRRLGRWSSARISSAPNTRWRCRPIIYAAGPEGLQRHPPLRRPSSTTRSTASSPATTATGWCSRC